MVLTGTEIKSARDGRVNLKDAYGLVKAGEVWLLNCHISPYSHGNYANHEPLRTRKLLLKRSEINRLIGRTTEKGLTLVPLRLYLKAGRLKCELALAKGRKVHDKREVARQKSIDKETKQALARGDNRLRSSRKWLKICQSTPNRCCGPVCSLRTLNASSISTQHQFGRNPTRSLSNLKAEQTFAAPGKLFRSPRNQVCSKFIPSCSAARCGNTR